jgi:Na+-transporting NADH:ubiquinone oxidoreductase subunit A
MVQASLAHSSQRKRKVVLVSFRKGVTTVAGQGPSGSHVEVAPVGTVGLTGRDYPGVTFDLRVAEGDEVSAGQTLCVDRHRPDICFVAPVAGRVSKVGLGARRSLDTLEIAVKGDAAVVFDVSLAPGDATALRHLLRQSGMWSGFRSRPFGFVPDPGEAPAAVFITATDTHPLAANPVEVLAPLAAQFQRGIDALLRLVSGPVFLCQPPGRPLAPAQDRLKIVQFAGRHPVGLAGTHIHQLMPVSRHRSVWQIGYQDVAALGHLLETGRIMGVRSICVAGPGVAGPAVVKTPLGARLADLLDGWARGIVPGENIVLLSGSPLQGREAVFLGRHDLQVTALAPESPEPMKRPFWWRLLDRLPVAKAGAMLPLESFERAFPFDLLPAPLMRALAVQDVETAERLGCLELLEEDLAVLSRLCPSGSDYGALLRRVLNTLAEEIAP